MKRRIRGARGLSSANQNKASVNENESSVNENKSTNNNTKRLCLAVNVDETPGKSTSSPSPLMPMTPSSVEPSIWTQNEAYIKTKKDIEEFFNNNRVSTEPNIILELCNKLLDSSSPEDLDLTVDRFRQNCLAKSDNSTSPVSFDKFWEDALKIGVYSFALLRNMSTKSFLNVVLAGLQLAPCVTLYPGFPSPPPQSGSFILGEQLREHDPNISEADIKKAWDVLEPQKKLLILKEQWKPKVLQYLTDLEKFSELHSNRLSFAHAEHVKVFFNRSNNALQQLDRIIKSLENEMPNSAKNDEQRYFMFKQVIKKQFADADEREEEMRNMYKQTDYRILNALLGQDENEPIVKKPKVKANGKKL